MINSPIIDVAIVLCFTYFFMSLMVTSINEIILSGLDKRAKFLKEALVKLFFDEKWKAFAEDNLVKSPHIQSLKRKIDDFPSYIPASNFVSAFIDCIRSAAKKGIDDPDKVQLLDMDGIRKILIDKTSALPDSFRQSLIAMFERSGNSMQRFQAEIEGFYNNSMDRVSGWYKRYTSKWIFGISFIISIAGNVDSIFITNQLWNNPKLKAVTDTITADLKDGRLDKDSTAIDNITKARQMLTASEIPMGWSKGNYYVNTRTHWVIDFIVKLVGLLVTTFALMLGAPFWFDLLNRFINIRGSGKKPADSTPAGDKYLSAPPPSTPAAAPVKENS